MMRLVTARYVAMPVTLLVCMMIPFIALTGCNTYGSVLTEERDRITAEHRIYKIERRNGSEVEFVNDSLSRARIQGDAIVGFGADAKNVSVPLSEVHRIYITRPSSTATIVNSSLVTIVAGVIVYGIVLFIIEPPGFSATMKF